MRRGNNRANTSPLNRTDTNSIRVAPQIPPKQARLDVA